MKIVLAALLLTLNLAAQALAKVRPPHLPNPRLTPGDTLDVTGNDVCQSGRPQSAGKLSMRMKQQVFDRYGIGANLVAYNVDHLIPVGLGGTNSLTNLWPQPLSGEWNYYLKNKLEQKLRKLVCSGALDLKQAQQAIATDWVSAYKKYVGTPGAARSSPPQNALPQ